MKKKKTVLKLGKETYGTKNIEKAFKDALAPYFEQLGESNGKKKV